MDGLIDLFVCMDHPTSPPPQSHPDGHIYTHPHYHQCTQEVVAKAGGGQGVRCKALNSGRIKNRRGVNVPNSKVDLPALTDKDKADLRYGVQK